MKQRGSKDTCLPCPLSSLPESSNGTITPQTRTSNDGSVHHLDRTIYGLPARVLGIAGKAGGRRGGNAEGKTKGLV